MLGPLIPWSMQLAGPRVRRRHHGLCSRRGVGGRLHCQPRVGSSCWRSRPVVPSPWGRLRPVSSGPPQIEGWGLPAHDGIVDTPCLPRNSWTSGAGPFTLWSVAPPEAPHQASGQPRSAPGSPGNPALRRTSQHLFGAQRTSPSAAPRR